MDNRTVSLELTLAHTQRQRNALADENAMLWARVEELTAELGQANVDLEKLRADAVSGTGTLSSASA